MANKVMIETYIYGKVNDNVNSISFYSISVLLFTQIKHMSPAGKWQAIVKTERYVVKLHSFHSAS